METETQVVDETVPVKAMRGRNDRDGSNNTVVLGPRDSLAGKLTVDGEIRVQGNVEGELIASGDVNIEGPATVNAGIEARNVTVRGTVAGDVTAKERLVLAGSGSLAGNVRVVRLSIEDGATLNGNVTMTKSGDRHRQEEHKEGAEGGG